MAAARTHRIPPQGGLEEPVRAFLLQKFVLKKPKESNLLDTYSCILRSTKAQRASSMAAAERITFNGVPENENGCTGREATAFLAETYHGWCENLPGNLNTYCFRVTPGYLFRIGMGHRGFKDRR